MFDSIQSPEDVDHLIAERIAYVKSQEVENLAEDKSDENSSSINSQNYINYINHVMSEPIDSVKDEKDTCLTKDTQENFGNIEEIDVLIEFIERMEESYFIENPVTYVYELDLQSVDKCEMLELQDACFEVTNEQETDACIQEEEVVSDMALLEVCRVDTEIHTDIQLETPMIKSEIKCVTQCEPKLVQDMALLPDTPTPHQTYAQSKTVQKISLPDIAIQGKLIPISHASWGEISKSESVRKEIPTYTDSICRPPSKLPGK